MQNGDDVALHDAAENVHQDGLNFRVGGQNLESFDDLLFARVPADVEEIRGRTSVELDDVHGRHGQTRSVHHASDVAVQSDVVQVEFARLHLARIFLR